jgi:hypothetical protein
VSFLVAITFAAEVGDVRRFATPQQLMAFLGLVPSERTTGDTVRRGSITKTGNHRARRVLIEGAWTCRFSARVVEHRQAQLHGMQKTITTDSTILATRLPTLWPVHLRKDHSGLGAVQLCDTAMPVSWTDLILAFEFISASKPGENQAFLYVVIHFGGFGHGTTDCQFSLDRPLHARQERNNSRD